MEPCVGGPNYGFLFMWIGIGIAIAAGAISLLMNAKQLYDFFKAKTVQLVVKDRKAQSAVGNACIGFACKMAPYAIVALVLVIVILVLR